MIRESGISNPEFGILRCAHGAGILWRKPLTDEPTGKNDKNSRDEILQLRDPVHGRRQLTMVIVTHSHEIAQAADRRIAMIDGRIVPSE